MNEPELQYLPEQTELQVPLRRRHGLSDDPSAEAVAAAEEAAHVAAPQTTGNDWDGVISRAFIAFSPLALFH